MNPDIQPGDWIDDGRPDGIVFRNSTVPVRNTLFAAVLALGGCVSNPPPMPPEVGHIKGSMGGVRSFSGIGEPGVVPYGPCARVLSIDGGGMRGIVPAIILAEIEKKTGKPISSLFDVIGGASTGAILALGLTRPDDQYEHQRDLAHVSLPFTMLM